MSSLSKAPLFIVTLSFLVIFLCFPSVRSESDPLAIRLPSDGRGEDLCPVSTPSSCPVTCFRPDPVCGVDGVTYWCGCADAICSGARVAKLGFCEVGNGGNGLLSGQALLLTEIVKMSTQGAVGECIGWAASDASGILSPYQFSRRVLQCDDISLKITHCGVCYADVIWTRNMHGDSKYPLVPGHEIAGIVKEVGSNVNRFKTGDHVGVGTYVNSCRDCENCNDRQESYCAKAILTFNSLDVDGTITKGGYTDYIVVHERYCFKIPDGYPLASAAPLLCAGITVYAPMMRHKMNQPGKSLGVIGLGGLGHMAVKFGKAFGLNVTVLSTSESKKEEALKLLGADKFVVSSDKQQMEASTKSLDFIIDTASGDHPFDPYMSLLKNGGVIALVAFPSEIKLSPASLNLGRRTISGSITGGTTEMQEMINFCAAHKIYPQIEVIEIQYINEALERLVKKDVKYRFVIGIENSLK